MNAAVVRPVSHVVMMKPNRSCHDTLEFGDVMVPIFDPFPPFFHFTGSASATASGPVDPLAFHRPRLPSIARRSISISTSTINHHYQNESRLPVSLQRCDESSRTSTKGDGHTAPTRQRLGLVFSRRRVQITVTPTTSYQVCRLFQPLPLLSPDGKHPHHGRSLSCWNEPGRITDAKNLRSCHVLRPEYPAS